MQLSRDGRLVRWAYFFGPRQVPARTTLCAFFWRAFVFVPLFAALLCVVVVVGVVLAVMHWWLVLKFVGGAAGVVGFIAIGCYLTDVADGTTEAPKTLSLFVRRIQASTLVQGIKAIKSSICPLIEIK